MSNYSRPFLRLLIVSGLILFTVAHAQTAPAPSPPIDINGKHQFANPSGINDDAATQLKTLCSLSEFQALPETDRHVYAFDPWPAATDSLGSPSYTFNFHLGSEGVATEKIDFAPNGGGPGGDHKLTRALDAASKTYSLVGFGNLDWSGKQTHVFKFSRPVRAFGVVLHSNGKFSLRKFFWAAAKELNGYPISYTLADGTVVQLGEREQPAAVLNQDTDNFIGVIDRSGRGIVSVTYTLTGLAGNKAQSINMAALAFATIPQPANAPIISLRSSCDFENPESIAATPTPPLAGLSTLDNFRFIVANHRYVYHFDTWPQAVPDLGSDTGTFSFDLKGKGEAGEKVTITASDSAKDTKLTQAKLKGDDGQEYPVLGGLGNLANGGWSEQTFKFDKPVWAFGATYRSASDLALGQSGGTAYPVSYTLSDGTRVNLGTAGTTGGAISANGKTYVGLKDTTDKGISSVTLRVSGTGTAPQPLYLTDLAFAIAGPPPGDWKLTMHDDFDGNKLNPAYWATGYTFPDVINNELQAYVPQNVVVANGVCTIKVDHTSGVNTDRDGRTGHTQQFSSGAFTSYGKFTQTYGYFEARIKMPHYRGAGVWPAFWMLADRGEAYGKVRGAYKTKDYGMGSEIDIFEFMPRWRTEAGLFPIHCGAIWSYGKVTPTDPAPHGYGSYALGNDGWGPGEMPYANADTQFHTYGIYWAPQRLIFYVDSKPIFRIHDAKNVPDVPEYFLFNIALSGNGWGKSPDKTNPSMNDIIGDMPNDMQIDYFRAYSGTLDEGGPTDPTDIPVIHHYPLPPQAPVAQAPPPAAKPAPTPVVKPATNAAPVVPAAPINSTISTPSQ